MRLAAHETLRHALNRWACTRDAVESDTDVTLRASRNAFWVVLILFAVLMALA
jgi:hypothetical protein